METRRGIIKSGMGLAAIIAAGKAPAAVVRSMIAGRQMVINDGGGGGISAKSYVQNGLIAMWDGIENAGWGVHDLNATVWTNLIDSTYDAILTQYAGFGNNYFEIMGTNTAATFTAINESIDHICYEIGILSLEMTNPTGLYSFADFSSGGGNKKPIWLYQGNIMFGWGRREGYYTSIVRPSANSYTCSVNTFGYASASERYIEDAFVNAQTTERVGLYYGGWPNGGKIGYQVSSNTPAHMKVMFIRLYNRYLTAAEIAYNYAVDKARFNLP